MKNTISEALKDTRYNKASTFIVKCLGTTEVYTDKTKLLLNWGEEEGNLYFLNTKEVMINIH